MHTGYNTSAANSMFRSCADDTLLAQALVTKVFLQYIELMRKVQTTYW